MNWHNARDIHPPTGDTPHEKKYVLGIDDKDRMSVGYFQRRSYGLAFVSAKAIGTPTHWSELPAPPAR